MFWCGIFVAMEIEQAKKILPIAVLCDCFGLSKTESGEILHPFSSDGTQVLVLGQRGANEYWEDVDGSSGGDVIDLFAMLRGMQDKSAASYAYVEIAKSYKKGGVKPGSLSVNVRTPSASGSAELGGAGHTGGLEKPGQMATPCSFPGNKASGCNSRDRCSSVESPEKGDLATNEVSDSESAPTPSFEEEESNTCTSLKMNLCAKEARVRVEKYYSPIGDEVEPYDSAIAMGCKHPTQDGLLPNEFPVEVLPGASLEVVEAVAKSLAGSFANVAAPVLGAASIAIGKGAILSDQSGTRTHGNIFLIVSQETGTGKSRTFRLLFQPIESFQDELQEKWNSGTKHSVQAQLENLEIASKCIKKKLHDAKGGNLKELLQRLADTSREIEGLKLQLTPPCILTEDATLEVIEQLLYQQDGNLAIAGSEARSVVDSLLGKGKAMHLPIFIKAFDGENVNSLHSTNPGKNHAVKEPVLQISIGIQPDKLEELFSCKDAQASGLLGRILIAGNTPDEAVFSTDPIPQEIFTQWEELLVSLLGRYRMKQGEPVMFELTDDALQALAKLNQEIEAKVKDCTYQHVRNSARRRVEYVRKFALILHLLRHPGENPPRVVSLDTLDDAMKLEAWFFINLLEFRGEAVRREELGEEAKVIAFLEMHPDGVSRNQIRRDCRLSNAEAAKQVMARLETAGKVESWVATPEGGGTPSQMYKIV